MSDTPLLSLPLLAAEQAQKHVTHNEALLALDAIVQLSVKDRSLSAPPGISGEGDRYIVAASPTGAWAGHAGDIASHRDGAWVFHDPREGWRAWVEDEDALVVFDGAAWVSFGGSPTVLQNMTLLGIGTTADATNPFSAKLNKALWTAKTAAEGGDGDLRYTLNKETAADVLSFLLQRGFSGRAEIGLISDDHLTVKVSADGLTWTTALVVGNGTGLLTLAGDPTAALGAATKQYADARVAKAGDSMTGSLTVSVTGGSGAVTARGDTGASLVAARYSSDGSGVAIRGQKARGTMASPAVVQNGDIAFQMTADFHDGSGFVTPYTIRARVIEPTPGSGAMGTQFTLLLAPLGSAAQTECLRVEPGTGLSLFGANPVIDQNRVHRLRSYTVATVPAASAAAGQLIYVSDESGGATPAFSDATNWRRVADRAVIS